MGRSTFFFAFAAAGYILLAAQLVGHSYLLCQSMAGVRTQRQYGGLRQFYV
jgi:hypothetical protein